MFIHPSPFASAENREIYHTVLAQRLKVETARKASERKKIDDAIEKILECPEGYVNADKMINFFMRKLELLWYDSIPSSTMN